jgi:hypothetical protein
MKKEFVTNVIHVKMQRRHLYIVVHVTKVANTIAAYWVKHEIIYNDMVWSFHFIYLASFF